jgi:hypothetical protein
MSAEDFAVVRKWLPNPTGTIADAGRENPHAALARLEARIAETDLCFQSSTDSYERSLKAAKTRVEALTAALREADSLLRNTDKGSMEWHDRMDDFAQMFRSLATSEQARTEEGA